MVTHKGEIKLSFAALAPDGQRKLRSEYFWDGKRIWVWDKKRFDDLRTFALTLQLQADGFTDPKAQIQEIKRSFSVSAALPIALHAAGDLVNVGEHQILCVEDILSFDERTPGDFPFITQIVEGILKEQSSEFLHWMARAWTYTRGESLSPPKILCVVGNCNSAKGLLPRLVNMTLSGRWRPRTFNLLSDRIGPTQRSDFSDLVFLINLSSCQPNISTLKKFRKLIEVETSSKRIGEIELMLRQVIMVRCHDSQWPPLRDRIQELTPHGIVEFRASEKLSIRNDEERMRTPEVIDRIQNEIRQFRSYLSRSTT